LSIKQDSFWRLSESQKRKPTNDTDGFSAGGWSNEYQDEIAAHEAGHMMGLYDEYPEEKGGTIDPITKSLTTNSLMSDLGPVQKRYFKNIIDWLEGKINLDLMLLEAESPPYPFNPRLINFSDHLPHLSFLSLPRSIFSVQARSVLSF
jgi:hypothetical protein